MFICIDSKTWNFLPIKHESSHVVGNLVCIEAPYTPVQLERVEWPFLTTLSDLQLVLLYNNTTGEQAVRVGDQLRSILMEIAERIPERDVNVFECDTQAASVPERGSKRFTYAKGAMTPKKQSEAFALEPVRLPRLINELTLAAVPRVPPVHAIAPRTYTSAGGSSSASAQRAPREPGAPRQAGVRELIWAVADKMWEAANKPEAVPTIMALRKSMMNTLESEHGVKRTSSSNELGQWMKARIVN